MIPSELTHPYYQDRIQQWEDCRDAYEGASAIRARMEAKHGGLRLADFSAQPAVGRYVEAAKDLTPSAGGEIAGAPYYPAYARTLDGLVGMVLRDPPKVTGTTIDWTKFLADVDGNGTPLARFGEQVARALLMTGRAVVYLNARAVGARDRVVWSLRRTEDLVSWITTADGALAYARLRETRIVPNKDAPEQLEKVEYLRIVEAQSDAQAAYRLRPGDFPERVLVRQVAESDPEKSIPAGDVLQRAGAFGALTSFPLIVGDLPTDESSPDLRPPKPPMLDLAELALSHYQTAQDLEQSLHWAGSPQPYVESSRPIPNLLVGPNRMLRIPPGARLGMLEASGVGLEAQEKALERKSRQMAAIGGRLIDEAVTRHAETATAMKLKSGGDRSVLGMVAGATERTLERALAVTAEWNGDAGDAGDVELTRDYVDVKLTADEIRELVALRQADQISAADLRQALISGRVIAPRQDPTGNPADE